MGLLPLGDDDSNRRTTPLVTWALIAFNVVFFLIELNGGEAFVRQCSFVPRRFLADPAGDVATLFSSMFMHAGWLHLGGNMLYLWIFGDNIEDRFGHARFLVFYLLSGLAATFAQLAFNTHSDIPNLGASGAIAGVLGSYVLLFPKGQVRVLMGRGIVPMPALLMIGLWFALQLFGGIGSVTAAGEQGGGGVAYMAHIGGFVAGFLLTFLFRGQGMELPASR
ncbi:MAG TPA: rhomboid family intramembrane serine protease [Gemmatimonadales bacterium]|nr:rhomboid family intramembrane serine protease [Gemmatimonadales bacterium]